MPNKYNLWKPGCLLAIDTIDTQHKRFFELCAKLAQLADSETRSTLRVPDLIKTVAQLRSYAFFHFYTEEDYLVRHGYPQLFKHMQMHDAYLDKLREIVDELIRICEDGNCHKEALVERAKSTSDWAANWWESHILANDKHYAKFILESKGKPSSE